MQVFEGIGGAWNYTIGPALVYSGPSSIDEINLAPMPLVVVAGYIPLEELGRIDLHHVYGFVLEGGGLGDPSRVFYSNQHRATVMQCKGILEAVQPGQTVVVDGVDAKVFLDPDEETLAKYEALRQQGPPPEPEGFGDQLVKDAMEMATLDPDALKEGFFDFDEMAAMAAAFVRMHQSEALSDAEAKGLLDIVKGTKVEDNVAADLQRYQDAAKSMSPEERAERQLRSPLK